MKSAASRRAAPSSPRASTTSSSSPAELDRRVEAAQGQAAAVAAGRQVVAAVDRPDGTTREPDADRRDVLHREARRGRRCRSSPTTSTIGSPLSHSSASTSWTPSQLRTPPPLRARSNRQVGRVAHRDGRGGEARLGGDQPARDRRRRRDRAPPARPACSGGSARSRRARRWPRPTAAAGRSSPADRAAGLSTIRWMPGCGQALDGRRRVRVGQRDQRDVEVVAGDQLARGSSRTARRDTPRRARVAATGRGGAAPASGRAPGSGSWRATISSSSGKPSSVSTQPVTWYCARPTTPTRSRRSPARDGAVAPSSEAIIGAAGATSSSRMQPSGWHGLLTIRIDTRYDR